MARLHEIVGGELPGRVLDLFRSADLALANGVEPRLSGRSAHV
jgi:hypothetical protein